MDALAERLLSFVENNRRTRAAELIVALLVGTATSVVGYGLIAKTSSWLWGVPIALAVASAIVWNRYHQPRRHEKGTVGFDVAIRCKNRDQEEVIIEDFLDSLHELLLSPDPEKRFHLIAHPQHIAREICSGDDAGELLEKTRGHFGIYGRARLRVVNGVESHVLELDGVVRHGAVSEEGHRKFSEEFADTFPRRLLIARENDLFLFSATAEWVDCVARYIVGVAAMISADLDLAERILCDLEEKLKCRSSKPEQLAKVENLLKGRIADVFKLKLFVLHHDYFSTHENRILEELERIGNRALEYDSHCPSTRINIAICAFMLRRDLDAAWRQIEFVRQRMTDTVWRYSAAFLYAYVGDLDAAWKEYTSLRNVFGKNDA